VDQISLHQGVEGLDRFVDPGSDRPTIRQLEGYRTLFFVDGPHLGGNIHCFNRDSRRFLALGRRGGDQTRFSFRFFAMFADLQGHGFIVLDLNLAVNGN